MAGQTLLSEEGGIGYEALTGGTEGKSHAQKCYRELWELLFVFSFLLNYFSNLSLINLCCLYSKSHYESYQSIRMRGPQVMTRPGPLMEGVLTWDGGVWS